MISELESKEFQYSYYKCYFDIINEIFRHKLITEKILYYSFWYNFYYNHIDSLTKHNYRYVFSHILSMHDDIIDIEMMDKLVTRCVIYLTNALKQIIL